MLLKLCLGCALKKKNWGKSDCFGAGWNFKYIVLRIKKSNDDVSSKKKKNYYFLFDTLRVSL